MAKWIGRGAALALVTLGLLGLTACGSDKDKSTTAVGQSPTTAATTPTTAAAVSTTQAAPVLKTANSDKFGTVITDATGKSLYTFDRDTGPTSACTATCAQTWPPLLLPAGAGTPIPANGVPGTLAVSARPDGAGSQVTWNGKPLYRYSGDPNPGDANGDGVGGIWHIAKA